MKHERFFETFKIHLDNHWNNLVIIYKYGSE